jgi:IclR family transcriptional regulator, acetate operon repressor
MTSEARPEALDSVSGMLGPTTSVPALVRRSRVCPPDDVSSSGAESSVAKALHLLESFGGGIHQLGVSELSRRTGIPKSSVHRLCNELTECGFLVRTPRRQYRLAVRVFELGSAGPAHAELRQTASRFLQQLTVLTGETAHLGMLDGRDVIYLDKIETPQSERLPSRVGHRNPAHSTAIGKAMLAWDQRRREELVAMPHLPVFTPRTIATGAELDHELAVIRAELVAFDREERTPGVSCVAAPIKDRHGCAVAAISVAGPTCRMTEERLRSLAGVVERVSQAASNYLRRRAVL